MLRAFVRVSMLLSLAACGGDESGTPENAGESGDTGASGNVSEVCRTDWECVNGNCECTTNGSVSGDCCDPAICGQSPDSCDVVCEVCTDGSAGDGGAGATGGGEDEAGEDEGGQDEGSEDEGGADDGGDVGACGADPCWDACNTDHGTCADRCGGGCPCWAECNTDHGTCAERCGPGDACWDECNTDHGTCAERCGPGARCHEECNTDATTCAERCG